jgi:hypothetical protein
MTDYNPGPATTDTPNIVDEAILSGTYLSTNLPPANSLLPGRVVYTSDQGLMVTSGTAWSALVSAGTPGSAGVAKTGAATYAAARLLTGSVTGDTLYVFGRTSQSDGGQGLFTWVAGGTTTINDGIQLSATGGIWQFAGNQIVPGMYGLTSFTFATLPTTSPSSYLGYSAFTTDQGFVFSNGVTWLLTTDTSLKAALLPGAGNATVNATAIMAASAFGTTVKLPAGTFYVGPMNFSVNGCQITGEGIFSTTLIFVPTGNTNAVPGYGTTDPGTCFQVCLNAGQAIVYNSSLKNLTINCTDTTYTKAAVRLCETSQFVLQDVLIENFFGGDSVGLWTQGHETLSVKRLYSLACIPLRIGRGLKAYATNSLTGVAITGVAGQFSCTAGSIAVGHQVTIAGTYGGTGSITGYTDPTTYLVSVTNGTTTFTLTTMAGGALTTTAGTPTGLTYAKGVLYSSDHFHFEDLYLATGGGDGVNKNQGATLYPLTLPHACVLMDDAIYASNLKFDGTQEWVGGQYGFYQAITLYPAAVSYAWSFMNIRKEQGWSHPNMFYYNNTSSQTYNLQQASFYNCIHGDRYTHFNITGVYFISMIECNLLSQAGYYPVAATNLLGMTWNNVNCFSTDVNNLPSNLKAQNACYYVTYLTPFSATWVNLGFVVPGKSKSVQTPTTGFSITIDNWINALILTPAGTLATGTVTMCAAPVDGMEASISTSQTITGLTVSPNGGQTIVGAPTTLAAGSGCKFLYDTGSARWLRLN